MGRVGKFSLWLLFESIPRELVQRLQGGGLGSGSLNQDGSGIITRDGQNIN